MVSAEPQGSGEHSLRNTVLEDQFVKGNSSRKRCMCTMFCEHLSRNLHIPRPELVEFRKQTVCGSTTLSEAEFANCSLFELARETTALCQRCPRKDHAKSKPSVSLLSDFIFLYVLAIFLAFSSAFTAKSKHPKFSY